MDIFGKHIFGSDAEQFIDLCFEEQVKWIENNTNQKDKEQIKILLTNLVVGKEECLDCKKERENYGRNISETIPTEVATDTQSIDNAELSKGNNTKRPRTTKRAKN
jgi:hypothetical protein